MFNWELTVPDDIKVKYDIRYSGMASKCQRHKGKELFHKRLCILFPGFLTYASGSLHKTGSEGCAQALENKLNRLCSEEMIKGIDISTSTTVNYNASDHTITLECTEIGQRPKTKLILKFEGSNAEDEFTAWKKCIEGELERQYILLGYGEIQKNIKKVFWLRFCHSPCGYENNSMWSLYFNSLKVDKNEVLMKKYFDTFLIFQSYCVVEEAIKASQFFSFLEILSKHPFLRCLVLLFNFTDFKIEQMYESSSARESEVDDPITKFIQLLKSTYNSIVKSELDVSDFLSEVNCPTVDSYMNSVEEFEWYCKGKFGHFHDIRITYNGLVQILHSKLLFKYLLISHLLNSQSPSVQLAQRLFFSLDLSELCVSFEIPLELFQQAGRSTIRKSFTEQVSSVIPETITSYGFLDLLFQSKTLFRLQENQQQFDYNLIAFFRNSASLSSNIIRVIVERGLRLSRQAICQFIQQLTLNESQEMIFTLLERQRSLAVIILETILTYCFTDNETLLSNINDVMPLFEILLMFETVKEEFPSLTSFVTISDWLYLKGIEPLKKSSSFKNVDNPTVKAIDPQRLSKLLFGPFFEYFVNKCSNLNLSNCLEFSDPEEEIATGSFSTSSGNKDSFVKLDKRLETALLGFVHLCFHLDPNRLVQFVVDVGEEKFFKSICSSTSILRFKIINFVCKYFDIDVLKPYMVDNKLLCRSFHFSSVFIKTLCTHHHSELSLDSFVVLVSSVDSSGYATIERDVNQLLVFVGADTFLYHVLSELLTFMESTRNNISDQQQSLPQSVSFSIRQIQSCLSCAEIAQDILKSSHKDTDILLSYYHYYLPNLAETLWEELFKHSIGFSRFIKMHNQAPIVNQSAIHLEQFQDVNNMNKYVAQYSDQLSESFDEDLSVILDKWVEFSRYKWSMDSPLTDCQNLCLRFTSLMLNENLRFLYGQMHQGEGRVLISAIFAIYIVRKYKKKVQIVTSTDRKARLCFGLYKDFISSFNISVSVETSSLLTPLNDDIMFTTFDTLMNLYVNEVRAGVSCSFDGNYLICLDAESLFSSNVSLKFYSTDFHAEDIRSLLCVKCKCENIESVDHLDHLDVNDKMREVLAQICSDLQHIKLNEPNGYTIQNGNYYILDETGQKCEKSKYSLHHELMKYKLLNKSPMIKTPYFMASPYSLLKKYDFVICYDKPILSIGRQQFLERLYEINYFEVPSNFYLSQIDIPFYYNQGRAFAEVNQVAQLEAIDRVSVEVGTMVPMVIFTVNAGFARELFEYLILKWSSRLQLEVAKDKIIFGYPTNFEAALKAHHGEQWPIIIVVSKSIDYRNKFFDTSVNLNGGILNIFTYLPHNYDFWNYVINSPLGREWKRQYAVVLNKEGLDLKVDVNFNSEASLLDVVNSVTMNKDVASFAQLYDQVQLAHQLNTICEAFYQRYPFNEKAWACSNEHARFRNFLLDPSKQSSSTISEIVKFIRKDSV